jgi:nitrogen regulatory protein PII
MERRTVMEYQKITVEVVVHPEDADAVISQLNSALDRLEETYEIFDGAIETAPVSHSGTRRKSALRHTLNAGNTAASGIKLAAKKVAGAYRKVI